MKKIKYYLPSIIFNVMEILIVILIGKLLGLNIGRILILIILFSSTRMYVKKAMHYKDWEKCLVMTSLFFLSLFIVAKADFYLAIIMTIFEAMILTGHCNIEDMFMWNGNKLNKEVYNWVRFNPNNIKLLEYEKHLKEYDSQKFYIFEYRFREFRTFSEISELMNIDTQRISEEINIMSHFIEYSIRLDN